MAKASKFVTKILLVIILFFMIFTVFIYFNSRKNDLHAYNQIANEVILQTSRNLDNWLKDQVRVANTIASDPRIVDVCLNPESEELQKNAENFLHEINQRYPYYSNIPLCIKFSKNIERNIDGKKVVIKDATVLLDSVEGKSVGAGGMEYPFIRKVFSGKDYYISNVFKSFSHDNPLFIISVPVKVNNKVVGIILLSPKMNYFSKTFVENFQIGETGYMFFIDARGKVIAHKDQKLILKKLTECEKDLKNIIIKVLNGEKQFTEKFKGTTKHYQSAQVIHNPENIASDWYIVFTQENKEIFIGSTSLLKVIGPMFIAIILLMTAIVYIATRINNKEIYEEHLKRTNLHLEQKVKLRTKELEEMAVTDGLTKLYNHIALINKIDEEIIKAKNTNSNLTIIMGDLDHFKKVNDNFGHPVGDEVLKKVAKTILDNISPKDFAGRYGGEEFVIALPDSDLILGVKVANKIKDAVESLKFSHDKLNVTISLGVSMWTSESVSELITKADSLLYKAKRNGRNRVEF